MHRGTSVQEAGARVTTNSFIRDFDLGEFKRLDGWRMEVIAEGLSLWQGAQLAVNTTLVSPLHRDGSARGAASRPDWHWNKPGGGRRPPVQSW